MIRLAAFDIDRTLVPIETGVLAPETRIALQELKRRGIKTAIATGRQWQFLYPELKELGFDYFIMSNGAYVTDGAGNVLCRETIDPAVTESLIRDTQRDGYRLYLRFINGLYCASNGNAENSARDVFEASGEVPQMIKDSMLPVSPHLSGEQPISYWIYCPEEALAEYRCRYPQLDFIVVMGGTMCDINLGGISKATGLKRICQLLGIGMEEAIAFGDDTNDLEMVREAGIGVAMGESVPELLAAADYVTDTCAELGVVKALKHFGLIG